MTDEQRKVVRAGYWAGMTEPEIAVRSGADEISVSAYLSWWCDRGCPPGGHGEAPEGRQD